MIPRTYAEALLLEEIEKALRARDDYVLRILDRLREASGLPVDGRVIDRLCGKRSIPMDKAS